MFLPRKVLSQVGVEGRKEQGGRCGSGLCSCTSHRGEST